MNVHLLQLSSAKRRYQTMHSHSGSDLEAKDNCKNCIHRESLKYQNVHFCLTK